MKTTRPKRGRPTLLLDAGVLAGAALEGYVLTVGERAKVEGCRFTDCYIRVRAGGVFGQSALFDCDTEIAKGTPGVANYVEGGKYRDLNFHEAGRQGDVVSA